MDNDTMYWSLNDKSRFNIWIFLWFVSQENLLIHYEFFKVGYKISTLHKI